MESVLRVSGLRKKYRNNRGIENISLEIDKGDVFGLLGANGAGKTTAMKVITGLIPNYSGRVELFGENLTENAEESMKYVGSLIEMPAFYPYLTAEKNMKLAAKYYVDQKISSKEIDEKLRMVNLLAYKSEKVSKFSLGMKQRMGLALAMVNNPRFYVLDEPSNGLDIEGIVEIRNIIKELAEKSGSSFLISSHQSGEIQKLCNKVGIISDGVLKNTADMEYILDNYPSLEDYYMFCINSSKGSENA